MEWTKEERESGFDRQQRLMRSIHDSPAKLTQPIQEETALILACEVTALREALEMTLPLLKEEQSVCEHSFLPEPNLEEQTILTTYSDVIERVESTLARIPK